MQINGFEIEKFNQYNLPENQKKHTCPLCSSNRKHSPNEKCLMIDWDRGLATCQHCGEVIQIHTYKKNSNSNKVYVRPQTISSSEYSEGLVKWFIGRGISEWTLRKARVSEGMEFMPQVGKEMNTIQFNYFKYGELVNIKYRDGNKNFKLFKDAEKTFYNIDNCSISEDIIICEGEIDVLSFIEVDLLNSVSIPNGSTLKGVNLDYLDNSIEFFDNKKIIYLALDNDPPGINTTNELVRRLGAERCRLVDFNDCKDANEYLVKYGNEALAKTIKDAKEVPIDNVSSVNDWKEQLDYYLLNGMQKGYVTGMSNLDNVFSTYDNQFIVVTGIPSMGKSEFVDSMVLGYARNYDWKIAFASPENKPNQIHAGKLLAKMTGQWIRTSEQINTDWYGKAVDWLDDHIKFIDLEVYDLDIILEKAKQLINKFGIKCLVIDPYNKCRLKSALSKDIVEYTNEYLNKIDLFARKYNVLIILVAHPRKPSIGDGKGYMPTFYDIKGGGEFFDMSPHGILIHRDYTHNVTIAKVLKVKFSHLGDNNAETYFKWDFMSGRYFGYTGSKITEPGDLIVDKNNWFTDKPQYEKLNEPYQKRFEEDDYSMPLSDVPF